MISALVGLLIVVAVVVFLAKVAIAGGIIGLIALILLVLILLRRLEWNSKLGPGSGTRAAESHVPMAVRYPGQRDTRARPFAENAESPAMTRLSAHSNRDPRRVGTYPPRFSCASCDPATTAGSSKPPQTGAPEAPET
jgi:hypothetical protein